MLCLVSALAWTALAGSRVPEPALLAGRIVAADGRGLGGARVVARPLPPGQARSGCEATPDTAAGARETRAAADGSFRLSVSPGSWSLDVHAPGHLVRRHPGPLIVTGGVSLGDIRLAPATAIKGSVVDARTRRPVAGAGLAVQGPSPAPPETCSPAGTWVTDESGRFLLDGLAPGVVSVAAGKRGYVGSTPQVVEARPGPPASLALALVPLASVAGRVIDETGRGVAGARLAVSQGSSAAGWGMSTPLGSTNSDASGAFLVAVQAPGGVVALSARAAGYAPAHEWGLALEPGQVRSGLVLRLRRGLQARGQVVAEDGSPIRGAVVAARQPKDVNEERLHGQRAPEPSAVTGDDGGFVLRGLEPGSYELSLSHPAHARRSVRGVEVVAPGPSRIPRIVLVRPAPVGGQVSDTSGHPVPGAEVTGRSGEDAEDKTLTDGGGRFSLGGIAPGAAVTIVVRAPGYSPSERVVAAPDTAVAVVLGRNGILRGRIEDAESRSPLPEFQVGLSAPSVGEPNPWEAPAPRSFRSEDGTFTWTDAPLGAWTIVARARGYQQAEAPNVDIRAGETTEVPLSLRRGRGLLGRVVAAATGTPVPGATVSYREPGTGSEEPLLAANGVAPSTLTDGDGHFELEGLPPGKLFLVAREPSYAEAIQEVNADRSAFVELRLPSGAAVSGQVLLPDGRTPARGAHVQVSAMGGTAMGLDSSTQTDGSGSFVLRHLRSGRHQLSAEGREGGAKAQEVALAEGEQRSGIVLVLAAGVTLRGRVRGLSGSEQEGVRVHAGAGSAQRSTSTDANGEFLLSDLPADRIEIEALASPTRSVSKSVDVPAGVRELSVDLEFPPPTRLWGRVSREGQPAAGVWVTVSPLTPTLPPGAAETDQEGTYVLEGLAEGDYVVSARGAKPRTVRVAGEARLDVELKAASLEGTAVDAATGDPIAGVRVELRRLAGEGPGLEAEETATDTFGRFTQAGLEEGPYRLVAHKTGFRVHSETISISDPAATLVVRLERADGLLIHARDGLTGAPLRGVYVQARSASERFSFSEVVLDAAGRGELPQLPAGQYTFVVFSGGYAPRSLAGLAVPGPPLDVRLTPGGALEIHIDRSDLGAQATLVDASGFSPLGLEDPGKVVLSRTSTRLEHLPPARYSLRVESSSGIRTYQAQVSEGQTARVEAR
jgi:5-hydroxyisourate hydrolase-like protein (transthyretin family)